MSPSKTPKSPAAGAYADEFVEETHVFRGREYLFRELDVAQYDELVTLSTSKNDQNEEMLDNGLLRKLMTVATVVSPKLPDGMHGLGMRLANQLTLVAQRINYGVEPEQCGEPVDGDRKCVLDPGHEGNHSSKPAPDIQEGEPDDEGEGSPRPISSTE